MIEQIWKGKGVGAQFARIALTPLEGLYRGVVGIRRALYDSGVLAVIESPIPVVSVGNLSVGGTGKTPVSAWIAARLAARGMSPAIVMRGYGGDESMVHTRMNPGVPVIVAPDRVEGIAMAATSGADIAVLDDAFQHRKASRDVDFVLVSADDWSDGPRMLPAGPFREPMSSLRRASAVIITRKSASDQQVASVTRAVSATVAHLPIAIVRLELAELLSATHPSASMPVSSLSGHNALAVAAIGNAGAFFQQLGAAGISVVQMPFPDHRAFSGGDIAEIVARSEGRDAVICTLKDAVKLGPMWPAGSTPLWYVSLAVRVESGEAAIDDLLMRLHGRIAVS